MRNLIDEKIKKTYITKGFLSSNDNPTQNALTMYCVYLSNLPTDWDEKIIHIPSVNKVRIHFGINYGFETMIRWGLQYECSNSKTSSKRHISMNKSYLMAKSVLSMGMFITNKKLMVV